MENKLKCKAISDLHGLLPQITDRFDVLFICGDIVPLAVQRNIPKSEKWIKKFFVPWINKIPCDKVYAVWGNHDFIGESFYYNEPYYHSVIRTPTNGKIEFLNDTVDFYNKEGKSYMFWGSPWCHQFGNWAFMSVDSFIQEKYARLPKCCDVCMTHDAPDIGRMGVITQGYYSGERAGNKILADAILEKKPKIAISGHIHSSDHSIQEYPETSTKFATVSLLDENYDEVYPPLDFEI